MKLRNGLQIFGNLPSELFSSFDVSASVDRSGCLWRLDACNMPMVDYAAQALSKALLTSRLTVLHLENTCLSANLSSHLELYLSENNLNTYQDSLQLGDLLKYNSTLKTLDLGNNTMSDSGFEEICDALSFQKTGLRTLILSNNHITHLGMSHLQNVLPRFKTLETLNLGKNNLENRGIHTLKESLMINRSLLQLGLASTGISCEGAVTLAEILAESPHIQRLDVRQNQVLVGGLMALSLALKINRSLIRLDLDQHLKEEKEDFLVETQKTLLSRISNLCTANATAAKGLAPLVSASLLLSARGRGRLTEQHGGKRRCANSPPTLYLMFLTKASISPTPLPHIAQPASTHPDSGTNRL
ncbi:protein phosphatase 1 regulatory subunit 37 [Carassius carassius]|uniref:protein phosphatase 1 regulatory subunit 37 n=1 Tax=Carassius carassius TaxID=217509 RepID=UPI00286909EF|nr:protein phosphatase 1 regulatory subunit 37 [Carassius carassius]